MKKEFKLEFTWKQKIYLLFLLTIVYGFILFLIDSSQGFKNIVLQALIYGVLMTLFFIFIFPWVMKKLVGNRINNISPDLLENEQIEEEIFANLFRGIEGVGGKIFFTNQRLIFKSHSLNIQKGQTDFYYSDIKEVKAKKTLGIINNGIKLITKEGKKYAFVVNEREVVLEKIKGKMG